MSFTATCFRYCLPLLALRSLGACQRASYSFQAPASAGQVLPTATAIDSTASLAASESSALLFASQQSDCRLRPQLHHEHVLARRLPKSAARLHRQLPTLTTLAASYASAVNRRVTQQEPLPGASPPRLRSKGIAVLLAFFLGGIGAHLFYLGYHGRGAAYLIATTIGVAVFTVAALLAIISLGSGAGFVTLAIIGAAVSGVVNLLALVDAVRIATGDLKPKNGEYFLRFFQTHQKP